MKISRSKLTREIQSPNQRILTKIEKPAEDAEKKFALVEYRSPDIHFEYPNIFITIRHYKCAHCGYMAISIKYDYVATS